MNERAKVNRVIRTQAFLIVILVCFCVGSVAESKRKTGLDGLYENRLLFNRDGRALIPVRLMERQKSVTVRTSAPSTISTKDETKRIGAGTTVRFILTSGQPARLEEKYVLQVLEGKERRQIQSRRALFLEHGIATTIDRIGGVYGRGGTVLDNRGIRILSDTMPSQEIIDMMGLAPEAIHIVVRPATFAMNVQWKGGAVATTDSVRLQSLGRFIVDDVEHSVGYPNHGHERRTFSGEVILTADRYGKIAVVNLVDEEVLVAGILPSELFPTAPMEALKAQAITARGELFAKIGRRHLGDPYLLCSEQHCQAYKGGGAARKRTTQAAAATRGQLLFRDGQLVDSVYSACCGGHTEDNDIVWPQKPKEALRGRVDAKSTETVDLSSSESVEHFLKAPRSQSFCGRSSFNRSGDAFRWTRVFGKSELATLARELDLQNIQDIEVSRRGGGGRTRELMIKDLAGRVVRVERELKVRKLFVPPLKSGLFVVDIERDKEKLISRLTIRGAGHGHGSGMCQQGAIGMAEAGYSAAQILGHYYGGAQVREVFATPTPRKPSLKAPKH